MLIKHTIHGHMVYHFRYVKLKSALYLVFYLDILAKNLKSYSINNEYLN